MERKSESSSLVMMASTFISRLLGILKSRALAVFFGAGALSDAINFAYNIPNNFRKLFAEGSLCQSYLPLFSSFTQDRERSSRLYSQLVSFLLLIFLLLFILSIFFSEFLIKLISGFCRADTPADPFKKPYAVVFFQLFYRQAYRRLGKVKLSGGFRNAAVLIYSHKYFHMAKGHRIFS